MNHEHNEHRTALAFTLNAEFLTKYDKGCIEHAKETPIYRLSVDKLLSEAKDETLDQYSYLQTAIVRNTEVIAILEDVIQMHPDEQLLQTALDILRGE
jgi:hypothetical protein